MINPSAPMGASSARNKHAWPSAAVVRKQLTPWKNGLVHNANIGKYGGAIGNKDMAATPTADLSPADRTSAAQLKGAIVEVWCTPG